MCAEYSIKTKAKIIQEELGVPIKNLTKATDWNSRLKMSTLAPVLVCKDNEIHLQELYFPVQPFPNARLSQIEGNRNRAEYKGKGEKVIRIDEVPLWKDGFTKFPCVVPMTSFFEPAYWGKHSGEVIEFEDPEKKMLFVAGILIQPRIPPSDRLNGFALLTHSASAQMLKFHHRLLVLLRAEAATDYLGLGDASSNERFNFLLKNRYVPKFKTSVDRKMAKGWEKRVEQHIEALEAEKTYLAVIEKTEAVL